MTADSTPPGANRSPGVDRLRLALVCAACAQRVYAYVRPGDARVDAVLYLVEQRLTDESALGHQETAQRLAAALDDLEEAHQGLSDETPVQIEAVGHAVDAVLDVGTSVLVSLAGGQYGSAADDEAIDACAAAVRALQTIAGVGAAAAPDQPGQPEVTPG
jgi:hypothetical protein